MESEYVTYLGVNVLNEGKIVSGGLFPQNVADLAPAGDISDLEQKLESPQQCRQKVASYGYEKVRSVLVNHVLIECFSTFTSSRHPRKLALFMQHT